MPNSESVPDPPVPSDGEEAAARRAFLAHARHELRTPLNAIVGYSELLIEELEGTDDPLTAACARDVRRIQRSGREMLEIVGTLLAAPASDPSPALDLDSCRRGLTHDLRVPLTAAIGYCEMLLDDAATESIEGVHADLTKIYKAAVRLRDVSEELSLAIDTGLDFGLTTQPAAAAPLEQRSWAARSVPAASKTLLGIDAGSVVPARLLVADDDEMNRDLLTRHLRRQGYDAAIAEHGRQALEMARNERFDLILLDVLMPELDGIETLKQLKGDTTLHDIPVIMISALDEMDGVVRCIELGAEDYLPKTFDPVLLRARIGACLEKKALLDRERLYLREIEAEKRRSDELLRVILPDEIVRELQETSAVKPRLYPNVAVLFGDVVGFTPYCANRPPEGVIADLQELIERYEQLAHEHGVQKIKTVGDAFMATAGLLTPVSDPVMRCVRCGLEMVEEARKLSAGWEVRVGVHCGPVVAGVVGHRQYQFDLWGDTVNLAAHVQSLGASGAVNVTEEAWSAVSAHCLGESLGAVQMKGRGEVEIYRVISAPAGTTREANGRSTSSVRPRTR